MKKARTRTVLAVAGVLLVGVASYLVLVRPEQARLSQARADLDSERSQMMQLRAELARLEDLEQRAPELRADLADVQAMAPPGNQIPAFIFSVQDAADRAGLDFVDITPQLPKSPPEGADLAQVNVTIGAQGKFFSIQDSIRRLGELDRAVRIDNFTLTSESGEEGDGDTVRLQLAARVFFELPEGATPAPATPASPDPSTAQAASTN